MILWTLWDFEESGGPVDKQGEDMEMMGVLIHESPTRYTYATGDNKVNALNKKTGEPVV